MMVWCPSPDPLILWQEEAHPHPHTEELATPAEPSSSRSMSLEVDSSSEASSGRSCRSFIGLSDMELLKFAFSHPQTEGATESPGINGEHFYPLWKSSDLNISYIFFKIRYCCRLLISCYSVPPDKVETNENDSLKYVPGKARSHHLEKMMSKEELEEEQRSVKTPNMGASFW